jgi:tryptophanyl-tRNA synthetase
MAADIVLFKSVFARKLAHLKSDDFLNKLSSSILHCFWFFFLKIKFQFATLNPQGEILCSASHVPVGDDQKQHLELTRALVTSFNANYNTELLTMPEPMFGEEEISYKKDCREHLNSLIWALNSISLCFFFIQAISHA